MQLQNPHRSSLSLHRSNYSKVEAGHLVLAETNKPAGPTASFAHSQFRALVGDPRFACVGAKSAVAQGAYRFGLYQTLGSDDSTAALAHDLFEFVREQPSISGDFSTFIATFEDPPVASERQFEALLWRQIQALHDLDKEPWDPTVNHNPTSPDFSFSFAGRAYFIVGLHPASSRWARRFAFPTLVFNAHYQFQRLRDKQQFERFQRVIRARDLALQGSVNPNLSNFGEASEALQYSGREVDETWKCPFRSHASVISDVTQER